ncbi:ABC transporter permease [Rugosimonospora africana]|uniref:Autoinducer 2 import system permease protein LsrD n=1 Tax=Rugosimonospora africana TaxID=556532 RepID=A0A8J3QPV4_9ACTN|nr:ABC transporter permease [Rugosimonospora africana]GIH14269.1 sugar ABC transporter permease [Rugosimonospora africana]
MTETGTEAATPPPAGAPQPSRPDTGGEPGRGRRVLPPAVARLAYTNTFWIFLVLVALVVFFGAMQPNFISAVSLRSLAADTAPLLLIAVGMTYVIISAGIDLSVGSVLIFSGVIAAKTMLWLGGDGAHPDAGATSAGWTVTLAGCLAGMLGGLAWGLLNGFMVARMKIPALIATLGTLGMALGATYLITGGTDVRGIPLNFARTVGFGLVAGVPWLVIIAVLVTVLLGVVLAATRFGSHTYAIGSNAEAARRVGIRVDRHLIKVYGISGLLAGIAGCLSLAHFTTTTISGHTADNLSAIAAVVLGGASLFGGSGTVTGSAVGLLVPAVLQSGFVTIQVNPYWQYLAVGAVLVLAVYVDQLRRKARSAGR